jgi:hypothetical protein
MALADDSVVAYLLSPPATRDLKVVSNGAIAPGGYSN